MLHVSILTKIIVTAITSISANHGLPSSPQGELTLILLLQVFTTFLYAHQAKERIYYLKHSVT